MKNRTYRISLFDMKQEEIVDFDLIFDHESQNHPSVYIRDGRISAIIVTPLNEENDIISRPHTCPVCEGKGLVPDWFYLTQLGGTPTSSGVGNVPCRSCLGTGIIWREK